MSHADSGTEQLDFIGYLGVIWRRKWLVALVAVVALVVALVLSLRQDATYASSTRVLLRPTAVNPPGSVPLNSTISLPTEAEIVKSQEVAAAAAETIGDTAASVRERTSVSYTYDNFTLLIGYAAPTADQAQAGAAAVAEAYLARRETQALDSLSEAVAKANEQISVLQEQATDAARDAANAAPGSAEAIEAANRTAQINGQIALWQSSVAALNVQAIDAGEVLVPAGLPGQPASPDHLQAALRGLLLGLVLGVAAALFSHAVSRRSAT